MKIRDYFNGRSLTDWVEFRNVTRDGAVSTCEEEILKEHVLNIRINDVLTMKVTCLSEYLPELVLGRLLTEGVISSVDEVDRICISEDGTDAEVLLKERHTHILQPVVPIYWKPEWVFKLADSFASGTPLHEKTWAAHSCFLAMEDIQLFSCEDLGRHNALDKTIGYALRQEIDLRKCILYSSGRIPTDMALKAIRAGIPVFVSKASPTMEAVQLAEQYNLTLICGARKDRMKLLCGALPTEQG